MSSTDYTAQAFSAIRTAEAERRLDQRRRAAERRASTGPATRPVAPSRTGFATLLFQTLHGSGSPAGGARPLSG